MWSFQLLTKEVFMLILISFTFTLFFILNPDQNNKRYFNWSGNVIYTVPETTQIPAFTNSVDSQDMIKNSESILDSSLTAPEVKFSIHSLLSTATSTTMTINTVRYPTETIFKTKLKDEAKKYRKILTKHGMAFPSPNGIAKRVIIVATWRSGSTFTAEVLGAVPGVFYHYEPLMYKGFEDLKGSETLAKQGIDTIANLLNCTYAPLHDYLKYFPKDKNLLNRNAYFEQICKLTNRSLCYRPDILSYGCENFPLQVTKSVRLPLRAFLPFLRKPELNLHVLLLVRDPRGTTASRRRMPWCKESCLDPKRLCSLLQENYEMAVQAAQEFPGSFTVLRYEDLALNPNNVSTWLFQKLKLPQTPSVKEYIKKHTTADVDLPWSTTRKLGSRVELWKKDLTWNDIEAVQDACGDTLTKYGYVPILSSTLLNETDSVLPDWKLPIPASDNVS